MQKYYYNKAARGTPYINLYKTLAAAQSSPQVLETFRDTLALDAGPVGDLLGNFLARVEACMAHAPGPEVARQINNYIDNFCQRIITVGLDSAEELKQELDGFYQEVENIFGTAPDIARRQVFVDEAHYAEEILALTHSEEAPANLFAHITGKNMTRHFAATPADLENVPVEKIRKICAEKIKIDRDYTAAVEKLIAEIEALHQAAIKETRRPEFNEPTQYEKYPHQEIAVCKLATAGFVLLNNEVDFAPENIEQLLKKDRGIMFTGNPVIPDRVIVKDQSLLKECEVLSPER